MKKLFAILMAICLLAGALSITAFAAGTTLPEPATGTVLRVTAIKGEDTVLVGDYSNFEVGWNAAMKIAGDTDVEHGITPIGEDIYIIHTISS